MSLLSLATEIRRASGDGQELLAFYFSVFRGEPISVPGRRAPIIPTLDHRMQAANWLADRGWGKVREVVELEGESSAAERLRLLRQLSDEERETLRGILTKALERAARADVGAGSADVLPDAGS